MRRVHSFAASVASVALLALAALGCRGGATEGAPGPATTRAARPATVEEALECAHSVLSSRGFSDVEWNRSRYWLRAQIPMTNTEQTVNGRVVRHGQVVVSVLSVDAAGYPKISANGTGRTKEFTRLAVSAAADVRNACPVRLGEKADPPPGA